VVHQQITSLEPLVALTNLQSLFVFNNQLTDISPVAKLGHLKELYFQSNLVESLQPLEHLTGLKTIYCNYNRIASLEGIGEQHADTLNQFICLPNELLRDREVMRFEREAGIRVTKA
jgi:Leucine-rich repeat (LRR) protein